MNPTSIIYEILNERFEISPTSKSGLKWKPRIENTKIDIAWNKLYAGKDCGTLVFDQDGRKYYTSSISRNNDKRKIFNHKVVYALHHKKDLDRNVIICHKDGNTLNNHPENLMESHNSEHFHTSTKLHSNNKSGCPGVHFCSRKRKYISQITFKTKKIKIGEFLLIEDAIKARKDYERKLFGT